MECCDNDNNPSRRDVLAGAGITAAILAAPAVFANMAAAGTTAKVTLDASAAKTTISRHIYGHFAEHLGRCIYEGIWVGENSTIVNTRGIRNDVVEALKAINIPNLRWPGGCFADTYHWKDGIGPREKRPSIVNVHWGNVTENNHFGTHEFFDLCSMLNTEPYVCGNVGSGTVQEMAEWLEYITMPGDSPMSKLRKANGRDEPWPITYWAVGNENWGCGGRMRSQYYADEYRRYQSFCRHFGRKKLYKVACGWDKDEWNETLMRDAGTMMDGLSLHYYTSIRSRDKITNGSATQFTEADWFKTLRKALGIDAYIVRTKAIMDKYDPQKKVGMVMDEWGTWYDVEPGTNPGFLYQQNTLRDALVAGVTFNIFHAHADRMHMANIAQTINVLQAMALTDGAKMLLTPTYHVFEMFKVHQNATLIPATVESPAYSLDKNEIPQVSVSASKDKSGKVHISLCNLHHDTACEVSVELKGIPATKVTGRILTDEKITAYNTFDVPNALKPREFGDAKVEKGMLTVALPARSVVVLELA